MNLFKSEKNLYKTRGQLIQHGYLTSQQFNLFVFPLSFFCQHHNTLLAEFLDSPIDSEFISINSLMYEICMFHIFY